VRATTLERDTVRMKGLLHAPWTALPLEDVRPLDLARWIDERFASGVSGPTLNRDLCLVSALYRWAVRLEHVDGNPAMRVERFSERGRARTTFLSAAEARALVDGAPALLRPLLVVALSTGMRRGELLSLRWRAVDLDRRLLTVEAETAKSGASRVVPLSEDACDALRRVRTAADGDDSLRAVFTRADGRPLTGRVLARAFEHAVSACASIPPAKRTLVTFHVLRHTAASLMVAAGVPLFDVSKVLGHASLRMTERYSHFVPETAGRAAVERLAEALRLSGRTRDPRGR
jgi:integrase